MSFLLDCSLGKTLSRLNLLDNLARAPLTFAITGLRQLRLQANMLQSSGALHYGETSTRKVEETTMQAATEFMSNNISFAPRQQF
jgi:hypothetical protein